MPPSITYSAPVIEAARGETRKATRSATSLGLAGPAEWNAATYIVGIAYSDGYAAETGRLRLIEAIKTNLSDSRLL